MALPCLKNYYFAAEITPLLYWCNEEYRARWKELEFGLITDFPLHAAIPDRGLMD